MAIEMTEAEYLEQQRLAALTTCATCGAETARTGNDVDYCSDLCATFGERKTAPIDHTRQTDGKIVDGWAV